MTKTEDEGDYAASPPHLSLGNRLIFWFASRDVARRPTTKPVTKGQIWPYMIFGWATASMVVTVAMLLTGGARPSRAPDAEYHSFRPSLENAISDSLKLSIVMAIGFALGGPIVWRMVRPDQDDK